MIYIDILACYILVSIGIKYDKGNITFMLAFWLIPLIIALIDIYTSLTGSYYYLLSLTIASILLLHNFKFGKPLYNKMIITMIAQVVFWWVMLVDYQLELYTAFDTYHLEVSIALTISQLLAAINGDTGIFNRVWRNIANWLTGSDNDLQQKFEASQ